MAHCLITGISGFLGSHLAEFLMTQGWSISGTIRQNTSNLTHIRDKIALFSCDIMNKAQTEAAVQETRPAVIFHLAAQSLPSVSWTQPEVTFQANVLGTLNLLEAVRQARLDPMLVVFGSSAEYGPSTPEENPIKEDRSLHPPSPYGVSKVATSLLALLYCRAFGMNVIIVRPFFVVGPRKVGDVCSDFARGIAAAEKGEQRSLKVGNLDSVRDFLDVRDAVQALWLLFSKAKAGEIYNLCSGVGHKIQTVLDILLSMASRPIFVERDPNHLRAVDQPIVIGDNSRLRALGWAPQVALNESLVRILDYWRSQA